MTRHDANALLDETFGGEDGTSPIQFGREPHYRRHASEKLVMDRLGRRYNRTPRAIQSLPLPSVDTRIPVVRLANYGLSMVLLWAVILAWAVSLVQP